MLMHLADLKGIQIPVLSRRNKSFHTILKGLLPNTLNRYPVHAVFLPPATEEMATNLKLVFTTEPTTPGPPIYEIP